MWQALYERIRQPKPGDAEATARADGDVVFFRHPPADEEPRCPHCPGVRLVPAEHDRMRCVWCTRVFEQAELHAA